MGAFYGMQIKAGNITIEDVSSGKHWLKNG